MPSGRRQSRLRDSRAGRLLANTGALNLFGGQEDEELDSTTAPPHRNPRAPRGPGGGGNLPPQGYHRYLNYPRWGKRGVKRWIPSWKLVGGCFSLVVLAMAGLVFWFWNSVNIPTDNPAALAQTTTVYYANGKDEIGRLAVEDRESVTIDEIPDEVVNAVLAAEDATFYTNSGVQWTSIVRAGIATVTGGNQQGGSTISQQYVKNVYDERELSYQRKMREAVLAIKVNQKLEKDEILERYLNTIYWGRGAWGIQAASKAYFNKDVGDLNASQGAFLAGIVNSPGNADPRKDDAGLKRAEFRWGVVSDAMVTNGFISANDRAGMEFPKVIKEKSKSSATGQAAYLMEMVKEEAAREMGIEEDKLTTGGYEIVTTFNKRLVKAGEAAVKDWTKGASKNLRVGMASVNPNNGAVLAIYGGSDISKEMNQATKDRAQAGSTFKPFGLVSALQDGVSLDSTYDGKDDRVIKGVEVTNFGNVSYGWIDLIKATQSSVNTVYVDVNNQVGPEKTRKTAVAAGVPDDTPDLKDNLVNVLGSANVHPIDMASAYSTFAAQGVHRKWHTIQTITKVEDDLEVFKVDTKGDRVFDKDVIADATYAMEHVVTDGSGEYAQSLNRPVAGKTGTSSDNKSAWFVGFTPQVATAVALHQVGKDGQSVVSLDGIGEFSEITGGSIPIRIWTEYMKAAMEGKDVIKFPEPSRGGEVVSASPTPEVTETPDPEPTETMQPEQPTEQPTQEMPTEQPTQEPTQPVEPTNPDDGTVTPTDGNNGGIFPTEDGDDDGNDGFG